MNAEATFEFGYRRCRSCRLFFTQPAGAPERECGVCRALGGRPQVHALARVMLVWSGSQARFETKRVEVIS